MSRLILPLFLGVTIFGAHLAETAWSKVNHHRITHQCGSC